MPDTDRITQQDLPKGLTGASPSPASPLATAHRGWPRWTRWLLGAIVGLVVAELIARFGIGLGDPPLTIRDPRIDYLFAPSRCYRRFHNVSCYNQWSMRAGEFSRSKQGCESRVMVLGDSIVNGGVAVDQAGIATELMGEQLAKAGYKTTVGNISAGSWGPANLLAYTERYGWFDADVAVFVLNSGDVADVPDFLPDLGPDYPSETPVTAVGELLTRYVPRYLPALGRQPSIPPGSPPASPPAPEQQRAAGIEALTRLLREARANVGQVVVLLHFEAAELATGIPDEGLLRDLSERVGAQFISLSTVETSSLYGDHIHLNADGQVVLGGVLFDAVKPLLSVCQP